MARPERHDVDYFPFYVKDGRTLFILESKYGCKGTGFFTNVMRFLCQQPDHYICINDESDELYFFAKTKCDKESGLDMLNIMSFTRKIHTHLWVSYKVIVSEALLNSLSDAYRNRKNPIITLAEIEQKYVSYKSKEVSDVSYPQEDVVSNVNKPQTKLKETKLKYRENVFLLEKEYQKLITQHGNDKTETMLDTLDNYKGAHGKNYISDYRAILSWVVEKIKNMPQPKKDWRESD